MKHYVYHFPNNPHVPKTLRGVLDWIHWHDAYAVLLTEQDSKRAHDDALEQYGACTIIEE